VWWRKIVARFAFANIKLKATSYERGEKQNESFKSNHDRDGFGQRLKLGCLCAKKRNNVHGDYGGFDADVLEIGFHLRIALT
jgi:hypothetical protein